MVEVAETAAAAAREAERLASQGRLEEAVTAYQRLLELYARSSARARHYLRELAGLAADLAVPAPALAQTLPSPPTPAPH